MDTKIEKSIFLSSTNLVVNVDKIKKECNHTYDVYFYKNIIEVELALDLVNGYPYNEVFSINIKGTISDIIQGLDEIAHMIKGKCEILLIEKYRNLKKVTICDGKYIIERLEFPLSYVIRKGFGLVA